MIEVLFTINGEEQTKLVKHESVGELASFLETYKQKVLAVWPEATNIRLGKYIQEEY